MQNPVSSCHVTPYEKRKLSGNVKLGISSVSAEIQQDPKCGSYCQNHPSPASNIFDLLTPQKAQGSSWCSGRDKSIMVCLW